MLQSKQNMSRTPTRVSYNIKTNTHGIASILDVICLKGDFGPCVKLQHFGPKMQFLEECPKSAPLFYRPNFMGNKDQTKKNAQIVEVTWNIDVSLSKFSFL